jgi:hypothetical protein
MRPFPLTAYLLGTVGPSSIKFQDGRGGLMSALIFYTFIRAALMLDFFLCLPVAIIVAIFKRSGLSKS